MYPVIPEQIFAQALRIPRGYWYVASPYSQWPQGHEHAFETAAAHAGRLLKMKVPIFSPIAHTHPLWKHCPPLRELSHQDWMDFDKIFVDAAHGTIVLNMEGWESSKGVQMEIEWTRAAGKPLFLLNTEYFTVSRMDAGLD